MALIDITCSICEKTFQMDVGHKTLDEIKAVLAKYDSFECPSHHFEIGSPLDYWTFGEFHNGNAPTDAEWIVKMCKEHGDLYTSDELTEKFEVTGFSGGVCVTKVKGTDEKVIFNYKSSPKGIRYYYR